MDANELWTTVGSVAAAIALGVGAWQLRIAILERRDRRRESIMASSTEEEARVAERDRQLEETYSRIASHFTNSHGVTSITAIRNLERLAQDHPEYRARLMEMICDYLRSPFVPSPEIIARLEDSTRTANANAMSDQFTDSTRQRLDELQVRLEAQQVITRKLCFKRPEPKGLRLAPIIKEVITGDDCERQAKPDGHWVGISLDLHGATLINLDLAACELDGVDFRKSRFVGKAVFTEGHIHGLATYTTSNFEQGADFSGVQFTGDARFDDALFGAASNFAFAVFGGMPCSAGLNLMACQTQPRSC